MSPKFYPSVMCMDCRSRLKAEVASFEEIGVDGFHVDIMDGIFVDGFISANILHRVRGYTALPLGVHLMVKHPLDYLDQLYESQPETIYVHFEAANPDECLVDIRKHGCAAGLAVCPETPAEAIAELLPMVDRLLLLRVPLGTTGQSPVSHVDEKIDRLVRTPSRRFEITCDGAISTTFVQKNSRGGGYRILSSVNRVCCLIEIVTVYIRIKNFRLRRVMTKHPFVEHPMSHLCRRYENPMIANYKSEGERVYSFYVHSKKN